ncbi:TPA: pentapeptide repeat-containing protein, partial [Escherichia coli]|nr:pentapeptide repeat-containing protein [Escherichia coli]
PHMHELFKCKIEFSDSVMTTTYFIGDKPVRTRQLIILQDPNGRFDFSRLNFEDTEFGESNFSNVNFNDANMKRATLMDCKLSGASFVRTDLTEAKGCADFSGCYMEYAILNGAQFENSSFKNATLFSCDVAGTNMSGVNFEYATIERGDFSTCILKNIVLREAKIIKMHTGSMRKFFFDDTPPLQDLIRVDICKAKEHIQKIYQIFEDISEDSMPEIKKILANELSTKNCIYDLAKLKKDVSEINCLAKYYTSN